MLNNAPLFGEFITMTFSDIYPSYEKFEEDFNFLPFTVEFANENTLSIIYYLLYSKYGNSNILNTDINQFKFALFSLIYQHAAIWERKMDLQKSLRELTDDEILISSRQVINHALNPSTAPATDSMEALNYINEQTTSGYRKNKIDAYTFLQDELHDNITEAFINRFRKLFISVVMPQAPLWYIAEN